MARRDETLQVRVTAEGAAAIEKLRGQWSKSEYVRQALALAVKNGLKGPDK